MQGIFVNYQRAKTKKALKEAIANNLSSVTLEATSVFGNEYNGSLESAPDDTFTIVGPDPYRDRKWYVTIKKSGSIIKVS